MAEDTATADVDLEGAPGDSSTSEQADHSEESPLTRSEVAAMLNEFGPSLLNEFDQRFNNLYRGVHSLVDSSISKIASEYGVPRTEAALMKEAAARMLGDDAPAIEKQAKDAQELADLKARDAQRQNADKNQQQTAQESAAFQSAVEEAWSEQEPLVIQHLKDLDAGLDIQKLRSHANAPKSNRPYITRTDPTGIYGFGLALRKFADTLAVDAVKAKQARVDTGSARGSGAGSNPSWDRAQKITKISDLSDADYEKLVAS